MPRRSLNYFYKGVLQHFWEELNRDIAKVADTIVKTFNELITTDCALKGPRPRLPMSGIDSIIFKYVFEKEVDIQNLLKHKFKVVG